MHKFMKLAGCKTEKEFYDKYPSEEHFFAEHPHMKEGGYTPHQGVLPAIMPGMYPGNMPVLMNQQATMPMNMGIPEYGQGGYHAQPGYYYNGHSMQKAAGSGTYDNGTYFKDGGIHINPANKGKFNATKKKTGKTTEELTHSSNPVTRKRAIFAQNAAKWHHQYGGPTGDYSNPFHPMHQYMAEGGPAVMEWGGKDPLATLGNKDAWGNPVTPTGAGTLQQPTSQPNTQSNPITGEVQIQGKSALDPSYGQTNSPETMSQVQQGYNTDYNTTENMPHHTLQEGTAGKYDLDEAANTPVTDGNTAGPKQPRQYKGLQVAAGIVGAGAGILGAASMYHDRFQGQKTQQQWMRDQNKSDNLPKYQNLMAKGTTDQYGNMPYNNMSQSANIRTMKDGGYVKGQEVELDEKQINELIRQGYKLQRL